MSWFTRSPTTSSPRGLKNSTSRVGCGYTLTRRAMSVASAVSRTERIRSRRRTAAPTVLVLSGAGGCDFDQATVDATAAQTPEINWKTLGLRNGPTTPNPWPEICAADVVITHAGQNCVADVASARRPAIVLAQSRPFDEQHVTAETLRRHGLACVTADWPNSRAWPRLIRQAQAADPNNWERWRTKGAAARAAEAIETTARRYSGAGAR